jgi:hypothetical protein
MLFVGDSFTMAGIDDYCAQNRNWLGRGTGFDRCIAMVEELKPTHIFNCHVTNAFTFTADECRFMRANLAERERQFGELFAWDHANYGMDESWVRCQPYEQQAAVGRAVDSRVVVTNHSIAERTAACRPVLPRSWPRKQREAPAGWETSTIPAKVEGEVRLRFRVPAGTAPGRYVVPVDVQYGDWVLPQWTEAVITVA